MITQLTERQALDVKGEIARNRSWVCFREFIEQRTADLKIDVEVFSEDLTKLLKREQALGAEAELLKLMSAFVTHVENNITIEKE